MTIAVRLLASCGQSARPNKCFKMPGIGHLHCDLPETRRDPLAYPEGNASGSRTPSHSRGPRSPRRPLATTRIVELPQRLRWPLPQQKTGSPLRRLPPKRLKQIISRLSSRLSSRSIVIPSEARDLGFLCHPERSEGSWFPSELKNSTSVPHFSRPVRESLP